MADTNMNGLDDRTLANALDIQDSIKEIRNATATLNRELRETNNLTTEYSSLYTGITTSASKVASIQAEAAKTSRALNKALEEQSKQTNIVRQLNIKIDDLYTRASTSTGTTKYNLERQARHLADARDNAKTLAGIYGEIADDTSSLNKSTAFFSQLSEVVKTIPGLKAFSSPFEKAAEASRKVAISNAKLKNDKSLIAKLTEAELRSGRGLTVERLRQAGLSHLTDGKTGTAAASILRKQEGAAAQGVGKAGMKALGAEMSGMFSSFMGKMGWIGLLYKLGEFLVAILVGAQEKTTKIAKNLGITREAARGVMDHFAAMSASSDNVLMNISSLTDAQMSLVDAIGSTVALSDKTLENQVFLTENLKISADAAADLNLMVESTGGNALKLTDEVIATRNAFMKIHGFAMPTNKLFTAIAKTSAEIKGYLGFSVTALAKGVMQTSKFGLELENALAISKSLLDFESSIGDELELELLTGRELNLEKARSMAITGDIAGATEEVMKQMQGMTAEQRKNPLIMESMAKATGLSADQLNKAYMIQSKLGTAEKDYLADLKKRGKEKEYQQATDMMAAGASREEIQKTLTAQDSFNAALEKAKDQFSNLVGSGALDILTDAIISFSKTLNNWGFGPRQASNEVQGYSASAVKKGTLSKPEADKLQQQSIAKEVSWSDIFTNWGKVSTQRQSELEATAKLRAAADGETKLATGGITKGPTKALIGEAGPEAVIPLREFYAKIDELIAATKQGKPVHLDGQKVNSVLGQNLYTVGG